MTGSGYRRLRPGRRRRGRESNPQTAQRLSSRFERGERTSAQPLHVEPPARFERAAARVEAWCSDPLSYGGKVAPSEVRGVWLAVAVRFLLEGGRDRSGRLFERRDRHLEKAGGEHHPGGGAGQFEQFEPHVRGRRPER